MDIRNKYHELEYCRKIIKPREAWCNRRIQRMLKGKILPPPYGADTECVKIKNYFGKSFDERWFSLYRYAIPSANLTNYIPDDYFYIYIDPVFNKPRATEIIDNKNLYDLFFYDVKRPKTILRISDGQILDSQYQSIDIDRAIFYAKIVVR